MGLLDDDGSGKGKILDQRQRSKTLTAVFAVGLCCGIVLAERLYIATNRDDILAGVSSMGGSVARPAASSSSSSRGARLPSTSSKLDSSSTLINDPHGSVPPSEVAAAVASDPELKALLQYLQQVAPEGEVLVGVSNQTPMLEGMLDTWLEGVKQAGVRAYA